MDEMARYRKAEVGLWFDEKFRSLSAPPPNGQTLWLYLLTGQRTTTFPGLVVAREAVMADDLGWSIEGFRQAFAEVSARGMAEADWKAGVVVLPRALLDSHGDPRETARPESPNVLVSWAKSWDEVPECELKRSYLQRLGSFSIALGEGYVKAYREAFRKALAKACLDPTPNQEQEQEQEEEMTGEPDTTSPVLVLVPSEPKRDPVAEAAEAAIAEINRLTNSRYEPTSKETRKNVKSILGERHSVEDMLTAIRFKVAQWRGDVKMRNHLTPGTLLRPSNFERYLEEAKAKQNRAPPPRQSKQEEASAWFPDRSDEVA